MDIENLPQNISRRDFLRYLLATASFGIASFGGLTGWETYRNRENYNPANPEIIIKKLPKPPGSKEMAVVHLTDIHFDSHPKSPVNPHTLPLAINKVIETLSSLGFGRENTIVTCTGDWVNAPHKIDGLDDRLIARFKSSEGSDLTQFPQAVQTVRLVPAMTYYGVLGNHDFNHPDSAYVRKTIENNGIQLIDGNPYQLYRIPRSPVSFIGGPDYTVNAEWYQNRSNLKLQGRAINSLRGSEALRYLTHNPMALDPKYSLLSQYIQDVDAEAGHTHGGNFGNKTLSDRAKRRTALLKLGYPSRLIDGDHEIGGNRVHISGGLGSHPFTPLRETPAEVIITIYI